MLNRKGYSIKEMIILCGALAILFGIGIAQTSYAYQDSDNTENVLAQEEKNLLTVAKLYVEANKDKFKENETYFYGQELIDNKYLLASDNNDFENTKIKVTHNAETDKYVVEIQ